MSTYSVGLRLADKAIDLTRACHAAHGPFRSLVEHRVEPGPILPKARCRFLLVVDDFEATTAGLSIREAVKIGAHHPPDK